VCQAIAVARSSASLRWSIIAAVSQLSAKYSSKAGCSAITAAGSRSMTAWNSRTSRASIVAGEPSDSSAAAECGSPNASMSWSAAPRCPRRAYSPAALRSTTGSGARSVAR